MKTGRMVLIVVAALVSWSCATIEFDKQVDLGKYHTFGWGKSRLSVANPAYRSDLIETTIKSSIKNEITEKGLVFKTSKPDVLVSYEGFTEPKTGSTGGAILYQRYYVPTIGPGFYPYGGYFMGGPVFWTPTETYSHTEGTLVIDVRDRRSGKLVWRGIVQGNVDNLEKLHKSIAKGVKAIMKKYPAVPPLPIDLPKEKVSF